MGIGLFTPTATAEAEKVPQVSSLVTNPIAPRGGVMMLPLLVEEGTAIRPDQVTLQDQAGIRFESTLVWLQQGNVRERHWTMDPRAIQIHPVKRSDIADDSRRLFLLARVPADGQGELRLNDQRLRPLWHDVPDVKYDSRGGQLRLIQSTARPDPDSPFEYWRWVLLADQLDVLPPSVSAFTDEQQLVAEHFSSLWTLAITRLRQLDPIVAERVQQLLTGICTDHHQAFGAWVMQPAALHRLLNLLLDRTTSEEAVIEQARAWAVQQGRPFYWLESGTSQAVVMAMVNPAPQEVVVRLNWIGESIADQPPLGVLLPAGKLTRIQLDRPSQSESATAPVLHMRIGSWEARVAVGPAASVISPPGLTLPPLLPALTLAEARGTQAASAPLDSLTLAQLRRREQRWEVFFECLRPEVAAPSAKQPDQGTGTDGVTLLIKKAAAQTPIRLFVPETGWREIEGGENDGTLQVHRQSYPDRWLCRIVLPDAWIETLVQGGTTHIGFMRSGRDALATQFGPFPAPPWQLDPGMFSVDLTQWEDVPTP